MSSNQTGHQQNVVNLGVIIANVSTFLSGYNPSRLEFTIPSLTQLKTESETVISSWNAAEIKLKNSISARAFTFADLDGLITRAINALRISGASEQTVDQADNIVRELRGIRASEKPTDEEIAAAKASGEEMKFNVLHNSTINSRIENFRKFILFLSMDSSYNPNEVDINIESLNAKLQVLIAANDHYTNTNAVLSAARRERDIVLYANITGLHDIAGGVKLYVKSAFGSNSAEYKSISDLIFTRPR